MTRAAVLPSPAVDEIVTRAGRQDFDRWAEQVARCGYCSHPVRLRGRVEHRSPSSQRVAYSTDGEPDRVLLIRCGNRRAAVCPSCSYEYAGDMWQLLYAGAAGGRKGVPESIRSHPLVFATLTAPGFGAVHTTRTGRAPCRPLLTTRRGLLLGRRLVEEGPWRVGIGDELRVLRRFERLAQGAEAERPLDIDDRQQLFRGVYAVFTGPATRETWLWAAVLCAVRGAVLSHQTAAELHGLMDSRTDTIYITSPAFSTCGTRRRRIDASAIRNI